MVVKLTRHTREDEDTLTDLLNERSRGGWEPALMSQDEQRLIVLFQRSAVAEARPLEIEFYGAAREVTGSCHILRVNGKTVLLDCGMFQGKSSDADAEEPNTSRADCGDRLRRSVARTHRSFRAAAVSRCGGL